MMPTWIHAAYLIAAILFIIGLKRLSAPSTARNGNLVAAAGVAVAVLATLFDHHVDPDRRLLIVAAMAVGMVVGGIAARRAEAAIVPQITVLFIGAGGGSAAAVSTLELLRLFRTEPLIPPVQGVSISLGALLGAISFSGSIVAWGKLRGFIGERASAGSRPKTVHVIPVIGILALAVLVIANRAGFGAFVLFLLACLLLGALTVLPVGIGDMPVVIPLLSSFTGFATAMTGFALHHVALIIGGALVGAAGMATVRPRRPPP
jgi:H+-translocating NAD(P) transhydrogenase subunit beta